MTPNHALTLTLVLAGSLQGCAGIASHDFACPGQPSKPLCLSTSEVYRLTEGYGLPQTATTGSERLNASPRGDDVLTEVF
jgi:hypothetical protein